MYREIDKTPLFCGSLLKTIDRVGDNAVASNTNLGSFYIQTVSLGIITLHFPLSQYMTEWAASIKRQW